MTRWNRARACGVALAVAGATIVAVAGPANVAGADGGLVQSAEWKPFPADTAGHGFLAVDSAARVGYAFSGTSIEGVTWNRVQALDLANGKPLSPVVTIPTLTTKAPLYVDTKRHVVVYAQSYTQSGVSAPSTSNLVGIGLRGGQVRELFNVPSPLGFLRVAGLSPDERGADLLVVATSDGTSQSSVSGTSVVEVQRLVVDDLMAGRATARWAEKVTLPAGVCHTLIQTAQQPGVLFTRDTMYVGCRGVGTFATGQVPQLSSGGTSGVVEVRGLGATAKPSPAARMYRTSGNFTLAGGESVVDVHARRVLLVETGGYNGLRVFDTDHKRYVGRINAGEQQLYGSVVDPRTSRVYFISFDPGVGLGYGDNAALVPTQGERLPTPFAALFQVGSVRRLSVDDATRRLFVPLRRKDENGRFVESILVMKDVADPYVAPPPTDYAAGAIDAVDRAGVTESAQAATARAFGADYQLIGGTANLIQNVTSVDTRGLARPGSRHLRQAYVRSAALTGDGALADALTAEEDKTTDADRHEAGAGSEFAPVASCTDFGAGAVKGDQVNAHVECDLAKESVTGRAVYNAKDGVLVTGHGTAAPVAAPVQMGNSSAEITERRAPNRGPLTTTIRAVAEDVTLGGVATFGRVEQLVTLSVHGRSGTAKVDRTVYVSEVSVNGAPVCGSVCSLASVQKQVNAAGDGRFWIEFPQAQATADKRGTYAELVQDPYVHAERSLDYDKAADDYVVPAMSVVTLLDSRSKMRLVTDFAAVAGTASYRVFPISDDDFGGGDDDGGDGGTGNTGGGNAPKPVATVGTGGGTTAPTAGPAPAPKPTAVAGGQAQGDSGPIGAILDRVRLSLRSLGDALPLLLIWALLGVPAYLSARRRLLLELPMLTRDEELTT